MNPRSFLEMLAEADLVLLNGNKAGYRTSDVSQNGDDENQIVYLSWDVGSSPRSSVLTEQGVREGLYGEFGFICEDSEGDRLHFEIFNKMKPSDHTKRVVSLNFTIGNDDPNVDVSEEDIETMRKNLLKVANYAIDNGLTTFGDKPVGVWAWGVTVDGSKPPQNQPCRSQSGVTW